MSLEDEGEIGAGGTATVRRMYDPSLRRRVAMKTLSPDLSGNPRAHRDFVQEAEITAQLEHPNIIPIHELAMVDGRASFSMRLIRGQNLQQTMAAWSALPDQADTLYRVLNVFLHVCDAVAFAHSRGVIHGDIKPANVMVGSFGEVYLVDWGVASLLPTSGEEPVTVSAERHTRSGCARHAGLHGARAGEGDAARDRRAHRHLRARAPCSTSSWPAFRPSPGRAPATA